jgi:hypothetical protein
MQLVFIMKILTTTIFLVLLSTSTFGQFSKGTKQLGGTVTIPRLGFFVNNKTSVGFGVGYTNQFVRQKFSSQTAQTVFENEIRTNLVLIELFSRYHISASENFYFFIEPSLTASLGKAKNGLDEEVEESIFGFSAGATPGILFMISDKFGLEGSFGFLGYKQTTSKITEPEISPEPKNVDKDFGLDLSLRTFQLGFQFYF